MLTDEQIADAAAAAGLETSMRVHGPGVVIIPKPVLRRFAEALAKAESAGGPMAVKWPTVRRVERLEDMSQRGLLRLMIQNDGDIIIAVQSFENGLLQPGASVEFCIPGTGGGRSPRTHTALRALMEAMAFDNQEEPSRQPEPGRG